MYTLPGSASLACCTNRLSGENNESCICSCACRDHAGAGYYDNDVTDDLGFVGALGYERKLAKHFTIGGSVKLIAGVDEVLLNTVETPVFQPTLSVALVF